MSNKRRKSNKKIDDLEFRKRVIATFERHSSISMNYRQLAKKMGVNDEASKQLLPHILESLKTEQIVDEVNKGRYRLNYQTNSILGKVDMTSQGYAYIISAESQEEIFVTQKNLRTALHGDTVKVHLFARRKGAKLEGQVVEVVERLRTSFVGTIAITDNFAFMVPDSRLLPYDLIIPDDKLNGAKDGQKVVASIKQWHHRAKNPIGEVLEVLGYPGENETEMHSILAECNLPYKFEQFVEDAAASISAKITEEEISRRRDFRDIPTFTIDPADAKDFDDALSLQKMENGNWEVGVHIADVSHYVEVGSIIDKEAINRATSVYLVDRTVPMLPEKLSNNLCSLRPNEDKLCFSAVFEMTEEAKVVKQWFGRTVVRSTNRLSYEEAQMIIDIGEGKMNNEIQTLHNLAQILRKQRFTKGSIAFDRAEPKFLLDETGKPLRVYFVENTTSHQLIEEFMLLANKKVAEFCTGIKQSIESPQRLGTGKVGVYRVHDKPNAEKIARLADFVKRFGYSMKTTSDRAIAMSINSLLKNIKGKSEENMLETIALRSMAKADYSTDNIGHYGLGFKYYGHFTSPIRRYPDLMTHRLLQYYLDGQGDRPDKTHLEVLCRQSSSMERKAVEAERTSVKYKQVEFMKDKVGETFDGVISGVTEWGIYVELDGNKCEGMVHIREMNDDVYVFDEDNYCLKGKRLKRTFQLGQPLSVEIWRANLMKKQLDFRLVLDGAKNADNVESPKEFSVKSKKPRRTSRTSMRKPKSKNQKKDK
jgi:ribonuclease R